VAAKRKSSTVLAVELDGRVAGTVAIWRPGSPESEAWVENAADLRHLAVAPEFQGRGLARPLLDEAERIAREEWKVDAICLHVRRGNLGVARLYQSRGYVRSPSGDLTYPEVELDAYLLRFK
jgi:ribosomal protein S18 acetylase RimI-like enzyme